MNDALNTSPLTPSIFAGSPERAPQETPSDMNATPLTATHQYSLDYEESAETPYSSDLEASGYTTSVMDSAEHFSATRFAVKDGMRSICHEESAGLVDALATETTRFEERLAGVPGVTVPTATVAQLQEFSALLSSRIQHHNELLEGKLEGMLDHVSVCLQEELSREQEHLMLMQHKLDTQSQMLNKFAADLTKKMDGEKSSRALMQRTVRENKDMLQERLVRQQNEIDNLRMRLESLESSSARPLSLQSAVTSVRKCVSSCFPFLGRSSPHTYYPYESPTPEAPLYEPLAMVASQDRMPQSPQSPYSHRDALHNQS